MVTYTYIILFEWMYCPCPYRVQTQILAGFSNCRTILSVTQHLSSSQSRLSLLSLGSSSRLEPSSVLEEAFTSSLHLSFSDGLEVSKDIEETPPLPVLPGNTSNSVVVKQSLSEIRIVQSSPDVVQSSTAGTYVVTSIFSQTCLVSTSKGRPNCTSYQKYLLSVLVDMVYMS